jgi:hypothetical protein
VFPSITRKLPIRFADLSVKNDDWKKVRAAEEGLFGGRVTPGWISAPPHTRIAVRGWPRRSLIAEGEIRRGSLPERNLQCSLGPHLPSDASDRPQSDRQERLEGHIGASGRDACPRLYVAAQPYPSSGAGASQIGVSSTRWREGVGTFPRQRHITVSASSPAAAAPRKRAPAVRAYS